MFDFPRPASRWPAVPRLTPLTARTDLLHPCMGEAIDVSISSADNHRPGAHETPAWIGPYAAVRSALDVAHHGFYSHERQRLQDGLVQRHAERSTARQQHPLTRQQWPWIIFSAGAMGAGKSHCIRWLYSRGYLPILNHAVPIDPDLIRQRLPEWPLYTAADPLRAGELTGAESGYICEILQEWGLSGGFHIWQDGSLRNHYWYEEVFKKVRRRFPSYRIAIVHVQADRDTVVARAQKRGERTGRVVPLETILSSLEQVPQSVSSLQVLSLSLPSSSLFALLN